MYDDGQFAESAFAFGQAIELDGAEAIILFAKGLSLNLAGQPQQAAAEFYRAYELEHGFPGLREAMREMGLR